MYEFFEHTADLGIRVTSPDLDGLFRDAAAGLFATMIGRRAERPGSRELRFDLAADRLEFLLLDWLSELLFVFESERLVLGPFDVHVDGIRLGARVGGRPLDDGRDRVEREVKAITYHGLSVEPHAGGWRAEVIVDI